MFPQQGLFGRFSEWRSFRKYKEVRLWPAYRTFSNNRGQRHSVYYAMPLFLSEALKFIEFDLTLFDVSHNLFQNVSCKHHIILCVIPCKEEILHDLNQNKAILSECILPGPDVPITEKGVFFTWDLYSKKQKERRISLFFYYHENSYLNMVNYNFPELKKYFRRCNDAPYQVVVEVDYKEDANPHDFTSAPSIQYYYIASSADIVPYPIIRQIKGKTFSDYKQVMQDIQKSYSKQGRTVKHLSTARTTFTFVTTSMKTREDNPLSDYVYETIKESLEDVFGSIR